MKLRASILAIVFSVFIGIPSVNAEAPVKIAAIFPQTGGDPGLLTRYMVFTAFLGVRIAVDRINAGGGLLGHPLELIELDNQSTAMGAKLAAGQAVKAGVLAVIGANRSSRSLAMARVLQPAGIPMITPISTNPEVTRVGNYIFRVCVTDDFQGVITAAFASREMKNTASTWPPFSARTSRSPADKFCGRGIISTRPPISVSWSPD